MNYSLARAQNSFAGSQLKPALFTFFAGAGFLDFGFERSGFEVVFVGWLVECFLLVVVVSVLVFSWLVC